MTPEQRARRMAKVFKSHLKRMRVEILSEYLRAGVQIAPTAAQQLDDRHEAMAWAKALMEVVPGCADELYSVSHSAIFPDKPETRPQRVYLMQAQPSCALKVGISRNPTRRRARLRGGLVHDTALVIVACVPGDEALEKALHGRWAALRINTKREWFHYDAEIVRWFLGNAPDGEKWPGKLMEPQ